MQYQEAKNRKDKVMRYIEWYIALYGGSIPPLRTMQTALGMPHRGRLTKILEELDSEGYIEYDVKNSRNKTIRLTAKRYEYS